MVLLQRYQLNLVWLSIILLRNFIHNDCYINLVIKVPVTIQGQTEYRVDSKDEYIQYKTLQNDFEGLLMNKRHLSTLSPCVQDAFDKYSTQIHCGKLVDDEMKKIPMQDCFELDGFRFYTSALYNAPYIPVVSPFEEWLYPHFKPHSQIEWIILGENSAKKIIQFTTRRLCWCLDLSYLNSGNSTEYLTRYLDTFT